jgi:predicted TIM-barrel fold metal-dependent hydrolase
MPPRRFVVEKPDTTYITDDQAAGLKSGASCKIDVHAHYLPPGYADELRSAGLAYPDGMPGYPEWSPQRALETYDRLGIVTGMLSISSPGVHYGDDAAAIRLARRVNEVGADTVADFPTRFGLFAELPMPNVEGSLQEIAYALDVLHADGIALKTNARGIYLGDPRFDPVFAELNYRKAVVFIHPTSPCCWQDCAMGYPRPMIEFPFDTTRAVTNLIFSGTLEKCPDIRIIVPHNGGALPMLAERITRVGAAIAREPAIKGDAMSYLRRLYFDTALAGSNHTLASLLQISDASHIVYGSDWPWAPDSSVMITNQQLESSGFFSDKDRGRIYRSNAIELLARLASLAELVD